jgi:hypothetical protein
MQARLLPFVVLAVGASLVGAGCGGGSASPSASASSTSTTSGASTANARQSDLRACLKKHGIDLPAGFGGGNGGPPSDPSGASGASGGTPGSFPGGGTPGSLPAGADQQKIQKAFQACGGSRNGFPGGGGANAKAFTAYLSCLSDHGVTVPTSTSGAQPGGPGALNAVRNDPKFAAANKTCQALLPSAGSTTTTTTSG